MKWNYFIIPLSVVTTSLLGSRATTGGMGWYHSLERSALTPPDYVFGIVWTILFVMIALAILSYWNNARHGRQFKDTMWLFVVNGVLNVLWSYLFFRWHLVGLAVVDAILLALSATSLALLLWRTSRTASLLLVPYILWLFFAVFLTLSFWVLN